LRKQSQLVSSLSAIIQKKEKTGKTEVFLYTKAEGSENIINAFLHMKNKFTLFNPILHTWFRDSYFTSDGS
jgi:hypothetical protein